MKIKTSYLIIGVLLAFILFYVYSYSQPGNYDSFAQCLTEKGAIMYGAEWCPHCKNQKAMFGKSFNHVGYVECPQNQELCNQKGIEGYPTWIINGEKISGTQALSSLSSLTGCSL